MKTHVVIAAVLVSAMAAGGCVSKSKYTEAVAETEILKTELEKTQALKTALEQQVKTLKDWKKHRRSRPRWSSRLKP